MNFRDSFPKEHTDLLRDMMIQLTAHSIAVGRNKVILRKLFVAVSTKTRKLRRSLSRLEAHVVGP